MMALPGVTPTPRALSSTFSAAASFSAGVPVASGPSTVSAPTARTAFRLTSRLRRMVASAPATASASSGWLGSIWPTRDW